MTPSTTRTPDADAVVRDDVNRSASGDDYLAITNHGNSPWAFPVHAPTGDGKRRVEVNINLPTGHMNPEAGVNRIYVRRSLWDRARAGSSVIPALVRDGLNGGIEIRAAGPAEVRAAQA